MTAGRLWEDKGFWTEDKERVTSYIKRICTQFTHLQQFTLKIMNLNRNDSGQLE